MKHLTSIVILSWNTLDFTRECIESIRRFTKEGTYEIIVVDNASEDGSREWLREQTDVRLVENAKNEGFPKGCNQGMALALGTEICLLNSDTLVTPRWLPQLLSALYSDESIGAVGPASNAVNNYQQIDMDIVPAEKEGRPDDSLLPGRFSSEVFDFAERYNKTEAEKWHLHFCLSGFALLFKRTVYEKLGGFDEAFSPGNFEDDDYCLRIRQAGWQLLFCEDTFIFHYNHGSFIARDEKSMREHMKKYEELLERNFRYFQKKWNVDDDYPKNRITGLWRHLPEGLPAAGRILDIDCACGLSLFRLQTLFPAAEISGLTRHKGDAAVAAFSFPAAYCPEVEAGIFAHLKGKYDVIMLHDCMDDVRDVEKFREKLGRYMNPGGAILYEYKGRAVTMRFHAVEPSEEKEEKNEEEQLYLSHVRAVRGKIERGRDLRKAAAALDKLSAVYPQRLEYLFARVALLLKQGEDKQLCRAMLDGMDQEFYARPELTDLFLLKSRTFPAGSLGERQCLFSREYYRTGNLPAEAFSKLAACRENFRMTGDAAALRALAEQYYVVRDWNMYFVLLMAALKLEKRLTAWEKEILEDAGQVFRWQKTVNVAYIAKMLLGEKTYTFLLPSETEDEAVRSRDLARALAILGQQTILFLPDGREEPLSAPSAAAAARNAVMTAAVEEMSIVVRCPRILEAGQAQDTMPAAMHLIAFSLEQDAAPVVCASDCLLDRLQETAALRRDLQRLSFSLPPQFAHGLGFAWLGRYRDYACHVYGERLVERIEEPAAYDFSIVIPVRNSADTLRHTLETCLALEEAGSFEIVVSDNSDAGNDAVKTLCEELAAPQIRYIRTPFVLELSKSFEYAILQARGEFIIPLGADDGIYPWALCYLKKALEEYPSMDCIVWDRDFYTWPGFFEEGRQDMAIHLYDKEQPLYEKWPLCRNLPFWMERIENVLYNLPVLYINSGFRRSYMIWLLEKTGRLWDGPSQDLYMAAVQLFLREDILHIRPSLTMAGMSGHSTGAGTQNMQNELTVYARENLAQRVPLSRQMGEYVLAASEYAIPFIARAGFLSFYMSIKRLFDRGIIDEEANPFLEMAWLWPRFLRQITSLDIHFEREWGYALFAAHLAGEDCLREVRAAYKASCARFVTPAGGTGLEHDAKLGFDAQNMALNMDAAALGCDTVAAAVRFGSGLLHL